MSSTATTSGEAGTNSSVPANDVVVYWRPGCPYCTSLVAALEQVGLTHQLVNIWEDTGGAAAVRSANGGDETVPTVFIGPAVLVNPDVHTVAATAALHAPHTLPDSYVAPKPSKLATWLDAKSSERQTTS